MSLPLDNKLSAESDTQTDISVSPHVLNIDEVANVVNDAVIQTTISCIPSASVSTILPQLKANLTHDFSNLLNKESNTSVTVDDISLKWPSSGVESVFELRLARLRLQSSAMDTDEETDEFQETVEYLKEPAEISAIDNSAIKDSSNEYEDAVEFVKLPVESQVNNEVALKTTKSRCEKKVEFVQNPTNSMVTDEDTVKYIEKPTGAIVKEERTLNDTTNEYEETVKYLKELIEPEATNDYTVKNSENEYDETVEHIQKIIESLVFDENKIKYPTNPYEQTKREVEDAFSLKGSKTAIFPLSVAVKEITMPVDVSETSSSFQGSHDFDPASNKSNQPGDPLEPSYLTDETEQQQGEEDQGEKEVQDDGGDKDIADDDGESDHESEGENKDEDEDQDQDEEKNEDKEVTEENDNATGPEKNTPNCPCGSNALKKIANKFRNQSLSVKLSAEEGPPIEERIIEALNATMSVLQSEMARLMDAFSDNKDISSTSCTCIDAPLTANDQIKITVDETRNTFQLKINKYTEVDDLYVSRNPPGDHVGHNSNNVECECHPLYSGAAPANLFGPRNEAYSETRKIKPRGPTVSSCKSQQPCCSKMSSHHYSRIPTPLHHDNQTNSPRGKRSDTRVDTCDISNKSYCKDKSTGVQTDLALGDKLQSESLSSLEDHGGMSWNHISLPPPGTYNIKSICKSCPSTKQTSVKIQEPRSSEPRTEIPWNDILLPQSNTFDKSAFSQASCSCRSNSTVQGKLSKPSISIKMKSSNIVQSKSYTDRYSASKITALPTTSDPGIQPENKAKVSIKILDKQITEINTDIFLKPRNNTLTVNLDDVRHEALQEKTKTESGLPVEGERQETSGAQEGIELNEGSELNGGSELNEGSEPQKENQEGEGSNDKDSNAEELQAKASIAIAPAQCSCKDNMKPTTFKPDPVMVAMETCEAEMKPLRQALEELQMKVRNLNIPELKGCMCTLALEEYSKCKSTLATGRPDPADIPHIDEPTKYNTYGPCASFKPARLYVPQQNFPFGRLPPPVLTVRTPMEINAPASFVRCSCKKRKHGKSKHDKEINTQNNIKCKPCDAHTNTKSSNDKKPDYFTFFSATETNSPFLYKQYGNGTSKKLRVKQSPPIESSKETRYYDTDYNDDDNRSQHQTMIKENHKHRKKKYFALPHLKKFDFDTSMPYHSVYDVQNLQPWQAVKTDPDDFLLPFKESTYINGFRSPHSLCSSILTQKSSK